MISLSRPDFIIGVDRKLNDGAKSSWSAHHFCRHSYVTIRILRRLARVFLGLFIAALVLTADEFQIVAVCRAGLIWQVFSALTLFTHCI